LRTQVLAFGENERKLDQLQTENALLEDTVRRQQQEIAILKKHSKKQELLHTAATTRKGRSPRTKKTFYMGAEETLVATSFEEMFLHSDEASPVTQHDEFEL
jgi:hypothetical protein